MFPLLKKTHLLAPIPVCLTVMLALAWTAIGHALVAPQKGQKPTVDPNWEQHRADQYDQMQQQQQQAQQERNLRHWNNDLERQQAEMREQQRERARLKYLLREHFRHHYKVIRNDAEELTQLASQLQSHVESSQEPALPGDMLGVVAKIQKLAHEVRVNMADRKLPKAKPSVEAVGTLGISAVNEAERKQALLEKSKSITDWASKLKKAVEGYLANDNEQTVSVDALKNATDKTRFDPNAVEILNSSMQLEQLACDIGAQSRADRVR